MEYKSFNKCIEEAKEGKGHCHLMLGNGFSISLFPNIFNYSKLKEAAKLKGLQPLFDSFQTNDYEYVMRKIIDAKIVLSAIDKKGDSLIQHLDDLYCKLSNTLIETIATNHPENPFAITEQQYQSCRKFLSLFDGGKIYTFNYDLLLYWVFMHFKDSSDPKLQLSCDDGFRTSTNNEDNIVWEIGAERIQTIYYIHGALHIVSNNHVIEKCIWKNGQQTIIEQVRRNLLNNKLPLFVCEGSRDHKKERIHSNGYLARSFASMKSIGGSLFIFGHSIRDEDDHVFDLILKNNKTLKNLFIGVYGDYKSSENQKIINKLHLWDKNQNNLAQKSRKKITVYQSEDVNVWNNIS